MKFVLVACAAAVNLSDWHDSLKLSGDDKFNAYLNRAPYGVHGGSLNAHPYEIPKADDPFIEVPAQTDKVSDPHPWAHEVQRVGHEDWLDKHVDEKRESLAGVPPMPPKEDRVAVYDS